MYVFNIFEWNVKQKLFNSFRISIVRQPKPTPAKKIWSRLELEIGTYNQRENRGYKYDLLQIEFI